MRVDVGQRTVKLTHPAMRVKRVVLAPKGELVITYIALHGGDEKTERVSVTAEEATELKRLKTVWFVVGGREPGVIKFGDREPGVERVPIDEVASEP